MNIESEPPSNLDPELVSRSLNFHGQLLQKQWEVERGEGDLLKHGATNLDFVIYSQRQRHLSFQDRGKRLKLHQFIAKKADVLFNTSLVEREEEEQDVAEPGHFATLPAYESFLNVDRANRTQHFLQSLKPGDVIICSIANKTNGGLGLKVLCDVVNARPVSELGIVAFCQTGNLIAAVDKKNVPRTFILNDLVCCEVLEVLANKVNCGMKGVYASEHRARLGLFSSEDFPEAYKLSQDGKKETYEELLEKSAGFHNPSNVACLSRVMGLGNHHHTNFIALKGRFPEMEYANELRNKQVSQWAFKNVAEGIEHFKSARTDEAFSCLNKALTMDPNHVEGLVARGALFANIGNLDRALEDFEKALKLNSLHPNARRYMGETLVAEGRILEEKGKMEEALKRYERCLEMIPFHEEALSSIEYVRSRLANGGGKACLTDGLLTSKAQGVKDTLKQLLGSEQTTIAKDEGSAKKKKKEKKPKKQKRHSSSSSSTSSTTGTSSSYSDTSSESSSASSNDSHRKKKHKSRKGEAKEKSLSPLSKRMAIMDSVSTAVTDGQRGPHYNPPSMPFSFAPDQVAATVATYSASNKSDKESEYEQRVCKFLEQTKGDSDYEEKVRKFLDETAKWKKDRKAQEDKAKKKRKKDKKARSKSKKKKREDRKKKKMLKELEEKKLRDAIRKQRRRSGNVEDEDDFIYGEKPDLRLSLPDLEDLQSKLSYFVKVEKGSTSSKKKEKSNSVEKMVAAAQMKAKPSSPKVMYMQEEEKEEPRSRKLEKKKMDMFDDDSSPTSRMDTKNVPLPPIPPPSTNKFKMQIGASQNRMKKRSGKSEEKDTWNDEEEKRFIYVSESVASAKEMEAKKIASNEKKKAEMEEMAKGPMIMDKLGGFRINPLAAEKKNAEAERNLASAQKRKLRPRVSDSDTSDSDVVKKKDRPTRSPASSRSRSRSRSHKKYSSESPPPKKYSSSSSRSPSYRKDRSRSKSGSYRSRSGRRYRSSESGSYRSRSHSRSRSRSRSVDYHRRSRSRSDDRHRYHKYPGRYPRNRGTYYRPRFEGGRFQKRPGFFPRGRGGPWRPGNRPFGNRPFMRGRGRPRFFHNNYKPRDDRYRRYERDMSRSDDDDASPMRKVDAAKERIDRMLSDDKRHSGPLSEGEERDDDYIDRKDYDRDRRSSSPEMDRNKKEGSKEKAISKPNPW